MKELRPREGGSPLLSKKRFAQFRIWAKDLTMAFFFRRLKGLKCLFSPRQAIRVFLWQESKTSVFTREIRRNLAALGLRLLYEGVASKDTVWGEDIQSWQPEPGRELWVQVSSFWSPILVGPAESSRRSDMDLLPTEWLFDGWISSHLCLVPSNTYPHSQGPSPQPTSPASSLIFKHSGIPCWTPHLPWWTMIMTLYSHLGFKDHEGRG